ncbi:hypothetical protein MTO96_026130 [Rhipicephalus appendiculatus]
MEPAKALLVVTFLASHLMAAYLYCRGASGTTVGLPTISDVMKQDKDTWAVLTMLASGARILIQDRLADPPSSFPLIVLYDADNYATEHFSGAAVYLLSTATSRFLALKAYKSCFPKRNDVRGAVLSLFGDMDPALPGMGGVAFLLHLLLYCSCGTTVATFELMLATYDTFVVAVLATML